MKPIRRPFHPCLVTCIRRPGARAVNTSALHGLRAATGIVFMLAALGSDRAAALDRTWIGGNVDWIDNGSTANWTGSDEPDADDTAIFNTGNAVNLGSNNTVIGLTMSGGISLNTNDFDLMVDGLVQLVDAGTDLTIAGAAGSLIADDVTINSGADIILNGGTLTMLKSFPAGVLDINAGGILTGKGTVLLFDIVPFGVPTNLLTNSGTISASSPGFFITPPTGTLTIIASDVTNARLDLDLLGSAVLNVFRNQTLDINVTLADAYSDDLNLFHNSSIDVSAPWSIDSATIDIDNGFVNNGGLNDIPASTSFIKGAAFTQTGGTITVIDTDGALQFNAPFTMNGGNLVNNGEVIFNANATIAAGANFTNPTGTSSLTVNARAEVNVDQLNFNADGNGLAANVITIGSLGILDLDLGAGGDTGIGSTLNLNGGELDVTTDTDTWSITGTVNIGASTGNSKLNGEALTLSNVPVTVGANSTLDVNATSTWASTASALVGTGSTLRLDAATVLSGASFTGAGTMVIGSTSTVSASTTVATGTFDWDGNSAGNVHTIDDGAVFTVTSAIFDNGDMIDSINLGGSGAGLTMSGPVSWEMIGTLTANPMDVGIATIGGTSRMVLTTATGILNANGDTTISSPVTFGALSNTTVAAPAILTVNGNAIYDGGLITGAGTYNPPSGNNNTVATSSTISATNFDFDRGNWTVDAGATLTVNVVDYDPVVATNAFDSTITLNSSSANITSGDTKFVIDGVLNLSNTTGAVPTWSGESVEFGDDLGTLDSDVNVTGTGTSQISVATTFNSDADVNISAGCTLLLGSTVNFSPVNAANNAEFTGTGTLVTNGTVNFNEATTLNMTGGTVDLDGTDSLGSSINVGAALVVNAATMSSFGKVNAFFTNILNIDSAVGIGSLAVNLDAPSAEWTLNAAGVLNLENDNVTATLLSGSAVNLNGTVNVTGDVRTDARVDVGASAVVNILTAGQPLRLSGGDLTTTNTINGGTINGPGLLSADNLSALTGFGTIAANANIDFDGSSDLLADNGTLTVNSTILDARNVGTADTDGTFNVVNAWNSSVVTTVLMQGGTLQGGALTLANINGMTGRGTVTAPVSNETQINANSAGQTLLLNNTFNIWDGGVGTGKLIANAGTLECQDNANFLFDGTVNPLNGGTVFTNGFALTFTPTSTLSLASGGTYKSTNPANIQGAVTVGTGTDSTIQVLSGSLDFQATSNTTLTGNLRLVTSNGIIRAGTTFGGAGALKIQASSIVSPENSANINVLLDNSGLLRPAGTGTGRVDVKDFQQSATGDLEIDLNGTGLANYDRLIVGGTAQIGGDLLLKLGGGYVPALNDTFNVLSATGGVLGTFNPLVQPVGMPAGRVFQITYSASLVQLKVVASSPFDNWISTFPSLTNPADKTKGANPDGDALNNLGEFALDGNPASGLSSGKIVGKIAPVGGVNAMTLTIPVRSGAVLDVTDPAGGELVLKQVADTLSYRLQAADNLVAFNLDVTEVTGPDATAIQAGLPSLNFGWVYRTFRSPGGVAGDPLEFMRAVISE